MKNKVVLVLGAVVLILGGIWFKETKIQGKEVKIKILDINEEETHTSKEQEKKSDLLAQKITEESTEDANKEKSTKVEKNTESDVKSWNIFNRKFHMVGDNIRTVEFTIDADGNMTGIDSTFEYESESSSYKTYCNYSGKFSVTEIIDDYTFRVKLTDYKVLDEDGKETIEDGMKNIASATDLFKDGQEFILYLSGRPVDDIYDIASSWAEDWFYYEAKEPEYDILKTSLLYNSETKTGYSE